MLSLKKAMNKQEKVNYWIRSAENDWRVAGHLFEKEDYPYTLFFGHLTIEKLFKALYFLFIKSVLRNSQKQT